MKTGGTHVPTKKTNGRNKFEDGDLLVCTKSMSVAYTEGHTYAVYLNDKGWKCLMGDDGLEDIISMLVSTFRKKET